MPLVWRPCSRLFRMSHGSLLLATMLLAATWLFLLQQSWKQVTLVEHAATLEQDVSADQPSRHHSEKAAVSGKTSIPIPEEHPPQTSTPSSADDEFPPPSNSGDWVSSVMYPATKLHLFIYSAYVDVRFPEAVVRVIAVYGSLTREPISCRMEYEDGTFEITLAEKKTMNEHWKLKYSAVFFLCPYSKLLPAPLFVRLKESRDHRWTPPVAVRPTGLLHGQPMGRFAVCIKPLHYNYNRASWLVEFVEFHRILGVDHFFFYNHSTGSNLDRVLRTYKDAGVASVLPWTLAVKSQKEIRTEGLFAALNDCLYRTMYHFDYTAMLDLDEFIVPRKDDTLNDLVARLKKSSRLTGFVLRNVFFYLYWENDTTAYGVPPEKEPGYVPYLLTQYKTRRSKTVFRVGSRSKYIVQPLTAVEAGNHLIWKFTGTSIPDEASNRRALDATDSSAFSSLAGQRHWLVSVTGVTGWGVFVTGGLADANAVFCSRHKHSRVHSWIVYTDLPGLGVELEVVPSPMTRLPDIKSSFVAHDGGRYSSQWLLLRYF